MTHEDQGTPRQSDQKPSWVEKRASQARDLGSAHAIGTMIVVGLLGGFFLGWWLEGYFGHRPWLSFAGMVLGGWASVRKVVQVLRTEQRRRERRTD